MRIAIQAVPALILGVVVDKACEKIQQKLNLGPLAMIIIQIIILAIVLYIIEKYLSKMYADEWQGTTPGLFFVSFYFGVQFNLFSNVGLATKKASAAKPETKSTSQ